MYYFVSFVLFYKPVALLSQPCLLPVAFLSQKNTLPFSCCSPVALLSLSCPSPVSLSCRFPVASLSPLALLPSCRLPFAFLSLMLSLCLVSCCFPVASLSPPCCPPVALLSQLPRRLPVACLSLRVAFLPLSCRIPVVFLLPPCRLLDATLSPSCRSLPHFTVACFAWPESYTQVLHYSVQLAPNLPERMQSWTAVTWVQRVPRSVCVAYTLHVLITVKEEQVCVPSGIGDTLERIKWPDGLEEVVALRNLCTLGISGKRVKGQWFFRAYCNHCNPMTGVCLNVKAKAIIPLFNVIDLLSVRCKL